MEKEIINYCTGWPDGFPTWLGGNGDEWGHCCKAHDAFYSQYNGWFGYFGAHWDLATCVGGTMGTIMFVGLCTLGSMYIIHLKNTYNSKNPSNGGNSGKGK